MRNNNGRHQEHPSSLGYATAYYHHQQHHHHHPSSAYNAEHRYSARPTRSFHAQHHHHQQDRPWRRYMRNLLSSSSSSSLLVIVALGFLAGVLLVCLCYGVASFLFSSSSSSSTAPMTRKRNHHHHAAHDPITALFSSQQQRSSHYLHSQNSVKSSRNAIRIFGPQAAASPSPDDTTTALAQQNVAILAAAASDESNNNGNNEKIVFSFSTISQQREFLLQHGHACQSSFRTSRHNTRAVPPTNEPSEQENNIILATFDAYLDAAEGTHYATELWKYCVLYTGAAHIYWNAQEAQTLVDWNNLLLSVKKQQQQHQSDSPPLILRGGIALQVVSQNQGNSQAILQDDDDSIGMSSSSSSPLRIHHALFQVHQAKSFVCAEMMRWLVERGPLFGEASSLPDVVSLSEYLGLLIQNDNDGSSSSSWSLWSTQCRLPPIEGPPERYSVDNNEVAQQTKRRAMDTSTAQHRGQYLTPRCLDKQFCCQVWNAREATPILLIRHPLAFTAATKSDVLSSTRGPGQQVLEDDKHDDDPSSDYMATVRLLPHANYENNGMNQFTDHPLSSPTFFDIMMENSCLPNTHDCFRCLKRTGETTSTRSVDTDEDGATSATRTAPKPTASGGGSCDECASVCHCYCRALCKIRPPPKPQPPQVWALTKPKRRRKDDNSDASRLIPRIIHQTWFEPVNFTKYPRMSRLVQSFAESGWEYHFYTDQTAAEFISKHFPPPVRQAYDALVPGAFKADLFRYCVLLIHGGVYADMDVLLSSNLDEVLSPNVGFMTAQDEPGQQVGHGSCLWNGFIAAAPAHPFLAQTVETVVNNIANRFTSVDYDDMLCPNPVLSVSHSFDVLFTTGPCILGASINRVLKRHAQTSFAVGDLDIFQAQQVSSDGYDEEEEDEEQHVQDQVIDTRLLVPGRSILLQQNKKDMGAHRFTWLERNLIVATTDLPDSSDVQSSQGNDKKKKKKHLHYSTTHENAGVYGLNRLYTNSQRADQDVKLVLLAS